MRNDQPPRVPKPKDYEPEDSFPDGHKYAGRRRCKAWSGNSGRQCLKLAMNGRNVCRSHGGATPRGQDSPHFKTGKFSRAFTGKPIGERIKAVSQADDLVSLREAIGVGYIRLEELLTELDDGAFPDLTSLVALHGQMLTAISKGDANLMSISIQSFGRIIADRSDRDRLWREIQKTQEHIKRLSEAERRMTTEVGGTISIEAVVLLAQLLALEFRSVIETMVADVGLRTEMLQESTRRVSNLVLDAGTLESGK